MATQNTPDGLTTSSLSVQQVNHLPSLQPYSHEYNNYPTLPVRTKYINCGFLSFASLYLSLREINNKKIPLRSCKITEWCKGTSKKCKTIPSIFLYYKFKERTNPNQNMKNKRRFSPTVSVIRGDNVCRIMYNAADDTVNVNNRHEVDKYKWSW